MAEPIFSTTTERIYKSLPEFYRNLDIKANSYADSVNIDYPLKKWLSGIVDALGDIDTTVERFHYVPIEQRNNYVEARTPETTYERPSGLEDIGRGFAPINLTSDLFDARTANVEWLNWLSNLLGTKITDNDTEAIKRDKLTYAYNGYTAGSRKSVIDAMKSVLTGGKYVTLYDHTYVVGSLLTPTTDEWYMTVVTKTPETPVGLDVSALLISKDAKPAGVKVYYVSYSLSWSGLESLLPTWSAIDATGTWDTLETTS